MSGWVLPELGDIVEAQEPSTRTLLRGPVSGFKHRGFYFETGPVRSWSRRDTPFTMITRAADVRAANGPVALTYCADCGATYSSPHVHDPIAFPRLPKDWQERQRRT